jgi:HNH endonuclease
MHPSTEAILKFFEYEHLAPHLQDVSKPFCELAHQVAAKYDGAELTTGLRKLLEAKDCIVRAALWSARPVAILRACASCGQRFRPARRGQRHCEAHATNVYPPSPSSLAARDPEYRRNRDRLLADNPTCAYCDAPATTADHIVPAAKGGGNEFSNLAPACEHCNKSKQANAAPRHVENLTIVSNGGGGSRTKWSRLPRKWSHGFWEKNREKNGGVVVLVA